MDIRCPSCSKLFRVADEKISGNGIRFKCSKCAETITITKDDFEMDLLAREAEATEPVPQQPAPATRPSPPTAPGPSIKPVPPPPMPSPESQAREYQPPQEQEVPSAALDDFDFSEPHAAAASAAHPEEGFGGQDFSFGGETDQAAMPEQDAAPEIELSSEDAAEAEAALQFPDDLVSEPARKPVFGTPSTGEPVDLGEPEQEPEPTPKPESKPRSPVFPGEMPKTGPVFTPPSRPKPAPAMQTEEEMDLGAALRISQDSSSDDSEVSTSFASSMDHATPRTDTRGDIHPFAAGNATGAVAGLCCALTLVALMIYDIGMLAKFLPVYAGLPLWQLAAIAGTGAVSMGVVIGIMLSVVQASAGKKLFFLLNILIGSLFGAGFGAAGSAIKSLAAGTALNNPQIVAGAAVMGSVAFALSILVVIARSIFVFSKEETFAAPMSGLQKAGLAVSLMVLLAAVYAVISFTGKMEQPGKETPQRPATAAKHALVSPEGLQVINAHGYIDPATGDLLITGTVRNTTDKPKSGWYLVTEVRDSEETVLATVKMVNGVQLFSMADYDVLVTRGAKIEEIRKNIAALGEGMIPAKGSVNFEVRIMNPPAGSAGFLPVLRAYDPATLAEVMQEGMGRK